MTLTIDRLQRRFRHTLSRLFACLRTFIRAHSYYIVIRRVAAFLVLFLDLVFFRFSSSQKPWVSLPPRALSAHKN